MPRAATKKTHNEYVVMLYRIALLMGLYSFLRLLFWWFNGSYFPNVSGSDLLTMFRGGLKFDISVIALTNLIYVFFYLSPLPVKWKFSKTYQTGLKILFISINTLSIAVSCIDLIYFRFIHRRSTYSVFKSLENEENMGSLWLQFLADYWYVFLLFLTLTALLIFSYSALKPKPSEPHTGWQHYLKSTLILALAGGLSVVAIRGGYRHSIRPINMSNAGKYVNNPEEMTVVLNTPFSILRNWGKNSYTPYRFYDSEEELHAVFNPIRAGQKANNKNNVVIFILESWHREYIGAFNKALEDSTYKGYTPFLDSLINHSLSFPNAFANGHKSIDAMPSIIASLPALVLPYISSEHSSNQINSLASILHREGYESAFFHGAQNGSMGFQSFAKIAGFDRYHGRSEYNNDADFDGIWGIWDEPFFAYYANEMSQMQQPFFTTLFSLSSHHPFKVPEQYEGVFPKGTQPVHQCVGYTDNALRIFFKKASKADWYKNTLFVITADHSSVSSFEKYNTPANRFAVPLLFFAPGDTALKGTPNCPAQQIDIMPTVLNYVGTGQKYLAFGQNLLGSNNNNYVINYTNGTYQLMINNKVLHFDGEKIISAFNYVQDPALEHSIKDEANLEKELGLVKAIVQEYNNRMIENRLTVE